MRRLPRRGGRKRTRRRTGPARRLLASLLLVAVLGGAGIVWLAARAEDKIGGPFTLENARGRIVTARDFRGHYMLVYFGYTHCPDICPVTLSAIAAALSSLGPKAERVIPVFITIDPARDTPSVMGRYVARFSPRLVGLTGTASEIAKVAHEYHVYYARESAGSGTSGYAMEHSATMYLMGPNGRYLAPLAAGTPPGKLALLLARLVS